MVEPEDFGMLIFVFDKSEFSMACNADLVQYIVEQCSGAEEITVKKIQAYLSRRSQSERGGDALSIPWS